ncbi:NUDIX domain-containing protein [Eisenbergiella sp.]
MDRSERAIFTNMCMVYDDNGNVLVQDRRDEDWGGITFPGGHVEKTESFTDSVIREIYEETGLKISDPVLCGVKQWQEEEDVRYVVLCYKTSHFEGELRSSEEGEVYWVKRSELMDLPIASGMDLMFQLFLKEEVSEHYLYEDGGEWKQVLK